MTYVCFNFQGGGYMSRGRSGVRRGPPAEDPIYEGEFPPDHTWAEEEQNDDADWFALSASSSELFPAPENEDDDEVENGGGGGEKEEEVKEDAAWSPHHDVFFRTKRVWKSPQKISV